MPARLRDAPSAPALDPREPLIDHMRRGLARRGGAVAVESDTDALTGDDILSMSDAIAGELESGDGPVAVLADHTAHSVAAFVAVLLSGRPAVLLDPLLPPERHARIVASAGVSALVGTASTAARTAHLGIRTHAMPDASVLTRPTLPVPLSRSAPSGESIASIVYTSGSTGEPKGVALSHDAVANGARLSIAQFGLTSEDRIALVLPMAFAAGQEVIAMALCAGAQLYCHDPRVHGIRHVPAHLRARRTTTVHLTPSLLRALTAATGPSEPLSSIRLFTTAGEPVHGRDIELARTAMPGAAFANYLGSSETGHLSFLHLAAGEAPPRGIVPAGTPVEGKHVRIVGADGAELPAGETGTIVVTSRFLARGYWNRPGDTAQRFAFHSDGRIEYTAGDRGYLDDAGHLFLAGRSDDAVKIRGYLVEPAEVEAELRTIEHVSDAAVVPVESTRGTTLVAYVVPDPRRRTPSTATLRARLRALLPEWMMPSDIVMLTALPRTERGKLDRRSLPAPPGRPTPEPAQTEWEAAVGEEWAAALELPAVGRTERFVELGGDSLAVEEMLQRVHDRLGVRLGSADLAEAATLAEFARLVEQGTGRGGRSRRGTDMVFATGAGGVPVYCFAGAGGTGLLFADLAARLDPRSPVRAFQANGLENRGIPDWSVERWARRSVRTILRETDPTAAVVLVGHSLGGLIALEAARQLRAHGYPRAHVVILDTVLPPAAARRQGQEVPAVRIPGGRVQTRPELWRTRIRLLGAGLIDYDTQTTKDVFFQHGLRLTTWYRPTPWDGPLDVLLTPENIDDRSWWRSMSVDPIDPVELDCDHVSLLKAPYVDDVASVVDAAIERTGRRRDVHG